MRSSSRMTRHVSSTSVPAATGLNRYVHSTTPSSRPPAIQPRARPGSARTISQRRSHGSRPCISFRPVNHAPSFGADPCAGSAPSSHQAALQMGLSSPIRVTSAMMA